MGKSMAMSLNRQTLLVLHNLGYTHHRLGQNGKALQRYEDALKLVVQLNESNVLVALTLNCVAVLSFHAEVDDQGSKALELLQQSLDILRSQKISCDREVATVANNIGRVYFLRSEFSLARTFYNEALTLRLKVLGKQSMDVAATCYNAGQTLQRLGEAHLALGFYKRFLRVAETAIGSDAREIAVAHKCMAEIKNDLNCKMLLIPTASLCRACEEQWAKGTLKLRPY
jgi:tetratricopeptide (TPR) repeat protein